MNRTKNFVTAFAVVLGLLFSGGCSHEDGQSSNVGSTPISPASNPTYRLHGLDFSPYGAGQDPNLGAVVSEAQLSSKMQIVKSHTTWIRTFGGTQGLERAGAIAHGFGLKAALGAWLGKDLNANERELQNLIRAGRAGEADLLVVGSEVLLRGDLTESQLLAYLARVRSEVPGISISYADTYAQMLAHPAIVASVDVVLVNYHPFWEGIAVEQAVATIHGWHQQIVAAANGKPVMVSETGWPSAGNTVGEAVPSAANASRYFLNFVSWARAEAVPYFYFEAIDEPWKTAYEGPQGAHWGLWDADGNLKPGMESVFNDETMPDNWSDNGMPGGPGKPTIELTRVPRYGSSEDLLGQVWHVNPADYKVVVFIYVNGWWTKPYWAQPLTTLQSNGRWICDITTGGNDTQATRIAAYLVPNAYSPPLMSGGATLPAELAAQAVAKVELAR